MYKRQLGPEANDVLAGIGFSLYYVDEANDTMLLLGTDNDMDADWDNGVFYDNFRGVWGSIDGNIVYMAVSYTHLDVYKRQPHRDKVPLSGNESPVTSLRSVVLPAPFWPIKPYILPLSLIHI